MPEIGLSKYKNQYLLDKQPLNPFSLEKNVEKQLVMRERESELARLELLKKKLLFTQATTTNNKNEYSNHPSIGRGKYMAYLEVRKRDRSGVIREINHMGDEFLRE